jgi:predicted Zn-dependent protease
MRSFKFLLVVLLLVSAALAQNGATPAQQQAAKEQIIQKLCRGQEITTGPEFDELHHVVQRLGTVINQDKQHRTFIALADNNEINAWATNFNMTDSMICVPVAMIHFMGEAQGELAFIIAHEVGHTAGRCVQNTERSGRSG